MVENEWLEWQKNKLWKQKVDEWTSRFKQVDGNNQEWQKFYHAYLQSDVWKEKRKSILSRANGKCEKCGVIIFDPDVHHFNYDRVGGNETFDDLIVLCFSCHQDADDKRDMETEERRNDAYYQKRLRGFALKKYGDRWLYDHDEQEVEIEFITFLYKIHCQEYGLDFDPYLDPESDLDFMLFWRQVLNGDN